MDKFIACKRITSITEPCIAPSDYVVVNVMSWHKKDTNFYELSPYYLKTDGSEEQNNLGGVIFENFWQGSKVYPYVVPNEVYPHFNLRSPQYLIWSWNKHQYHIDNNGNVLPSYYLWRNSIFDCPKAIRYPNTFHLRHSCRFTLLNRNDGTSEKLEYLEARKRIYCAEYMRLVRKTRIYQILLEMVRQDKKICIFEIDVPAKGKKGYYGSLVDDNNIFHATSLGIEKLLNDTSEPFGHGLCLAKALLEDCS